MKSLIFRFAKPSTHADDGKFTYVKLAFDPPQGRFCGSPFGVKHSSPTFEFKIPNDRNLDLQDWITTEKSNISADFYGVDRSLDPIRLSGMRYPSNGRGFEETILKALEHCNFEGAMPDLLLLPTNKFREISHITGYRSPYLESRFHKLECVEDPSLPENTIYMLQKSTWTVGHTLYCDRPGHNTAVIFSDTLDNPFKPV